MKVCVLLIDLAFISAAVLGLDQSTILIKQAADSLLLNSLPQMRVDPSDPSLLSGLAVNSNIAKELPTTQLSDRYGSLIHLLWDKYTNPLPHIQQPSRQILGQFRELMTDLAELERRLEPDRAEEQLDNLDRDSTELVRTWTPLWDNVKRNIGSLDQIYTNFESHIRGADTVNEENVKDFARMVDGSGILDWMQEIHAAVSGVEGSRENENRLFVAFNEETGKGDEQMCRMTQSPAQLMYNLYNIIAITDIKGFAMIQFAYMILKINKSDGEKNYEAEAENAKDTFEKFSREKLDSFKRALPGLSQEYHKCDPPFHEEGKTFLQVKKLMQGYIENEVDMSDNASCQSQCSEYNLSTSKNCYQDLLCAKQKRCNGRIFDCKFYNADAWVCLSQNMDRRYDWIEYEDGTKLGSQTQCANKIKVDSWWRYLFWHCSYCFCKCEDDSPDREVSWSLIPATANISQNMIVTGVRVVKKNKIFFLQVQEAKAKPEGGVDENTKRWVELPSLSVENNPNTNQIFRMSYEERAIDLDKLEGAAGHVLTGVKLRKIGGHINLEIRATPINFSSGQLSTDRSVWIASDNTPATSGTPRELLSIVFPDVPTKLNGKNVVDSKHDQYLDFTTTADHKDAAQTTVPFIDSQEIVPSPTTWLSGAGIYHKGRTGYGGFVGLSVLTYDYSKHL